MTSQSNATQRCRERVHQVGDAYHIRNTGLTVAAVLAAIERLPRLDDVLREMPQLEADDL